LLVYLASRSAARRRLLQKSGFDVRVVEPPDDPPPSAACDPYQTTLRAAKAKLNAVLPRLPAGAVCVAADTLVVCNGRVLGKPQNADQALAMLRLISGKRQKVITGVCVGAKGLGCVCDVAEAQCEMAVLSEAQMQRIIEEGRAVGVSGGYAIMEEGDDPFCRIITGEKSTVVGLPLQTLQRLLNELEKRRCSQA